MGGPGSTRWAHKPRRHTTAAALLRLHIDRLVAAGLLGQPCRPGKLQLGPHWIPFTWYPHAGGGLLRLTCPGADETAVILEARPQPFGGSRWFMRCPRCEARCRVLYLMARGGALRCRACHRLAYPTTRMTPSDRLDHRIHGIERKLGAEPNASLFGYPDRPPGMRLRTYARLIDRLHELHEVRDEMGFQALGALLRRHRVL